MKQCRKCQQWKDESEFRPQRKQCRQCCAVQCRIWRAQHPDYNNQPVQDDSPKRCTKCGLLKDAVKFRPHHGQCQICELERARERRRINPDHVRRLDRKYRERHRDKRRGQTRAYYIAHTDYWHERFQKMSELDKQRAYERTKKWQKANQREIAASQRERRKNDIEFRARENARNHRRRARKRAAPGNFTAADIERIRKAQKGRCYYCGKKRKLTVEHIIPLSRGGSNWPGNIVLACKSCNSSKGGKLPHEWPDGGRLL